MYYIWAGLVKKGGKVVSTKAGEKKGGGGAFLGIEVFKVHVMMTPM